MLKLIGTLMVLVIFTSSVSAQVDSGDYMINPFPESEYDRGFDDGYIVGYKDAVQSGPVCLTVLPRICDEFGNLLPINERVYNGEPRCYIDILENCYERKQNNSDTAEVGTLIIKKLKNKIKKLRKSRNKK